MLKTIKKLIIILIFSLLAVLILGALLYHFYFAPKAERYLAELVQSTLAQQFKREVSIGSIRLNFPNPQITISDVAIARHQKLSDGTLLSAKMLKAKVLLRSLVSKQILIDEIVLDTPTVWIEFDEHGQSNLPAFGGAQKKEKPSRFRLEDLVERVYFPHIQLIDAQIYFAHKRIPLMVSVDRFNTTLSLALKGFQAKGMLSLQGGTVEFQNRGKMTVALSGDLKFENPVLTLSSFDLQVNRSKFSINGTLANLAKPNLNLAVNTQLALEEWDHFLRINQNLAGMVNLEGTVKGHIPDVIAAGHLTCSEGSAWKLNFKNVSTDATYQQKQVIITNLEGNIFGGRATGNGQLSFSGTPWYQASLALDKIGLEYVNTLISRQLPLKGDVSGNVDVHGDSFKFDDLMLHATLNLLEVDAYNVRVPQGSAQVDIQNKTLSLSDLRADVFQGKVAGGGSMVLASEPNYQATLEVQKVNLDPIMVLIPQKPAVSGIVSGKITASGAKFDLDAVVLEANLEALDGEAYTVQAKTLNTSVRIKNGVLSLPKWSAKLFDGDLAGQGMLVLSGETRPKFDVRATLKNISAQSLIRQFAPQINNNGITFDGRIAGDVVFAGSSYKLKDMTGTFALAGKGGVDQQGQGVPFDWLVKCSLRESVVDVSSLNVDSAPLKLSTSGTVNIASRELNLHYEIASKDIQTMLKSIVMFIPGLKTDSPLRRFSGKIEQIRGTVQGPVARLQIQAEAHFTNPDLVWIAADDLTADITYQENTLRLNRCRAVHRSAEVEINGTVDLSKPTVPQLELPISLKSGKLSDYLALVKQAYPIEGTLKAVQTTITGPIADLHGKLAFEISDGTAWAQSFEKVLGKLELANNRVNILSLTAKKNGGKIALEGFFGFDLSFRVALTATEINFRDLDAFKNIAVQYQGRADLTFEAEGTLQNPRGKAAIRFKNLVYSGKPVEDITCEVVIEKQAIQATLATVRKKFLTSLQLSLTSEFLYRAEIVMESAEVEQILSLVTNLEGVSGLISGKIISEGSLHHLNKLSASVKLSELQLDVFGQQIKNSKEIDVVVTPQKLTVNSLELKGKELGVFARGFLDFQGNFDLALDGIIDLRPMLTFLPRTAGITSLAGRAQIICNVRGTFNNPEIEGIAEINDGSLQLAAYPDPVENISGKLALTKGQLEIVQLQGDLSKGSFTSHGTFTYHGLTPDTLNLEVEGKNIVVHEVVEALTLTVSPRLKISGDLKHQKVTGEVLIQEALYRRELDFRALVFNKSRNIVLIPLETGGENGQREFDLYIKAPKNIQIRNDLAEFDLGANLHVQGTVTKPQLEGRIEILKGKIQFGGIKYQIISGVLNFANPLRINPEMNIQATTVVQEYKIWLGVEGNLDRFTLDMRSEPGLSKGEITRLLAAGSNGVAKGYNLVTKPVQKLVEGQIEKAVKLDQFKVDVNSPQSKSTGAETATKVTLGKRLFKDLLLTFTTTVGATEKAQTLEVEYQLSDNISLTASRDEKGDIDTSFTFKFKIK